ncbi:hypothetical protein ACP_0084 [Acidobacterium capsulatum ATCC 51196]|uniref:Uncharacterized protein n=1 Tax=Acidobacterium capsulatum (strain ATCC 51196 / DSM 11244 / BCRC 80197 / JCM 7670 / NBRC 15755 / NCIMB 13165 / 161) TaxID=240015 RepID=C1F837_ACIC5|nr:hypothetical protein ACP_0084 [Acidobacterium capsulatum ATCC 51196]
MRPASASSLLHHVGRLRNRVQQRVVALRSSAAIGCVFLGVIHQLHQHLLHLGVLLQIKQPQLLGNLCPAGRQRLGRGLRRRVHIRHRQHRRRREQRLCLGCRARQRIHRKASTCNLGSVDGRGSQRLQRNRSLAVLKAVAGDAHILKHARRALANRQIIGGIQRQQLLGCLQLLLNHRLLGLRLLPEGVCIRCAVKVIVRQGKFAQLVGRASGPGQRCPGRIAAVRQAAINIECIGRTLALLQQSGNLQLQGRLVGRISGRDQQFGARVRELVDLDEVLGHFQAHIAPPLVAVALPGAVQCRLIIVDGLRLLVLPHGQPRQLQIHNAAARFLVPQGVEVGHRLLRPSGLRQRLGQLNLGAAVRNIAQSRTQGLNGSLRLAFLQFHLAALPPAMPQFLPVILKRAVQKVGKTR